MITPPIALAAFAAASISKAGQIQTGIDSFRVGWVAYLLPFLFIYKPALLMQGTVWEIGYVFVSSVVGLALVAGGGLGHARFPITGVMRLVWLVAGLCAILPLSHFGGMGLELSVSLFGVLLLAHHFTPSLRPKMFAPPAE